MILKPKIKLERVTDISVELLKKYNIKALILDVDNTLSTHHGQVLTDGLQKWLSYMKENEIKLMVLSNSKKKRVEPFANKIDLDFISLGLKPLPFGYIRAIRALSVERKNAAIVGDQIFTDVLGGNALGIKTILLTPIKEEKMWSFRVRRSIEKKLFKKWQLKNTEV